MVDALEAAGVRAFGPSRLAAEIESSKVFSKNLMKKYGIPTARYEVFDAPEKALAYLLERNTWPAVIKADGLALGKGVVIAQDEAEAKDALHAMMEDKIFGDSGSRVVVEEFLTGPEAVSYTHLDVYKRQVETHVMSAHRTPAAAADFASRAKENGFGVIIAAAGKAAHLGGVLAAHTTLPVIGIPVKSSTLDGLDALLATVQMPSGIPVATVAIDGAENAAILAVQMLALSDEGLAQKLSQMKEDMAQKVLEKDAALQLKAAAL